jgi:putative ABC transport system ATP-binding protein
LLHIIAGVDRPTSGECRVQNVDVTKLNESQLADWRNQNVGFIFQNFQLLSSLTALENVMVPMELKGGRASRSHAMELLTQVGLTDRSGHYPSQLSGGEQQRVALARAFANGPRLLFADEPTGNLDGETAARISKLIFDLNRASGIALVLVTHDLELAARCRRILRLKNGTVLSST